MGFNRGHIMPYSKPTLSTLIDAVKADLFARFPGLEPQLANSFATNIAEVIAGSVNGLYGYLEWISRQQFPDTADQEFIERWASIYGLSRLAATKADGNVTFTGGIGSSVSTGAELTSADGTIYTVDTGFTLAAVSEDHAVTAQIGGSAGNLGATATLSFVSTPSGITSTATVATGGLTGGTDRETDAELRARILQTISSPPMGGKAEDYDVWAKEATDVTRSWVRNTTTGATYGDTIPAGEVWQWFVMDDTYQTDATYGIPAAGDATDIETYIAPLAPVTAVYDAKIPTADTVDFSLTIVPDTPENQTAVQNEIRSAILANRIPGGTIYLSEFQEAMSRVPNLTNWTINSINAVTPADVVVAAGVIHTIGTFTFV
jgi:uncharacterized phage protein gp47/JayE